MRRTAPEREAVYQRLRAAYDEMRQAGQIPTYPALARAVGLPLRDVYSWLRRTDWWSAASHAAAKDEGRKQFIAWARARGFPGPRSAVPHHKRLNYLQVQEILRLNGRGQAATAIAKTYGITARQVRRIQTGKSWRGVLRTPETAKSHSIRIDMSVPRHAANLFLSRWLYEKSGMPTHFRLSPSSERGYGAQLEPATDGYKVVGPQSSSPRLTIGRPSLLRLCLGQGRFAAHLRHGVIQIAVLAEEQRLEWLFFEDARVQLGISRQRLYQLISKRRVRTMYAPSGALLVNAEDVRGRTYGIFSQYAEETATPVLHPMTGAVPAGTLTITVGSAHVGDSVKLYLGPMLWRALGIPERVALQGGRFFPSETGYKVIDAHHGPKLAVSRVCLEANGLKEAGKYPVWAQEGGFSLVPPPSVPPRKGRERKQVVRPQRICLFCGRPLEFRNPSDAKRYCNAACSARDRWQKRREED